MKNKILPVLIAVIFAAYILFGNFECIFLKYFHIICPGCGMTRAVKACLRLDFKQAFAYHPMVFSLPFLFVYIIKNGRVFKKQRINLSVIGIIATGFLVTYIYRLTIFFS